MAKVIFEFDDEKDKYDINVIVNRDKLLVALEKLCNLRGKIYNAKLYNNEIITVKDNKVLTDDDYKDLQLKNEILTNTTDYIDRTFVENELGTIIDGIIDYLNI
jgi:hypothetical protein